MGSLSSKPLGLWTKEEVADAVATLGNKYEAYADRIRDNGVDGKLLTSLDEEEFKETLADLEITSRLHKRVLSSEWKAAKDTATDACNDVSPVTTSYENHKDAYLEKMFEAAAEYGVTPETDPKELEPFDHIAEELMEEFKGKYAGIHLLNPHGHACASSRYFFVDAPTKVETKRRHEPKSVSFCYKLWTTERNKNVVMCPLPPGYSPFYPPEETPIYLGHVLKTPTGERIGMICVVVGEEHVIQGKEEKEESRKEILRKFAVEAEKQLHLRKVLLDHNKKLEEQISKLQTTDAATTETVQRHLLTDTSFNPFPVALPMPAPAINISSEAIEKRNLECETLYANADGHRRSARMPVALLDHATKDDMKHIASDCFDELDAKGIDRTPIPKNDMERVASLYSLGLPDIGPKHSTTLELNKLVQLAVSLFDVPIALIRMMSHDSAYSICIHTSATVPKRLVDFVVTADPPHKFDSDGKPFQLKGDRFSATCNYTVATKRTYTCHDLYSDESFSYLRNVPGGMRFYSGSPIMWRGFVVAELCLLDCRARPDFGATQELQVEHIAQLISQQIENFALQKDMELLERERRRLSSLMHPKPTPPEDYAALVFTDIQGSTKLWESNSNAMHQALKIHDDIMRQLIAAHCGYEITTAGDAFHVAFHDAIDAVHFALDAQEALHKAPWGDDVLNLVDASNDVSRRICGLRVRMAVHCGPVTSGENAVSGKREYSGSTVCTTKSLEDMAHGGQILVSSDVWNVACYFCVSKLGAPQVVDLGVHVLGTGNAFHEGVIAKGVLELVPSSLAFDYFAARTLSQSTGENSCRDVVFGRRFAPPTTQRQMTASFHDAPHEGNFVAVAFIYTCEVEKAFKDPTLVLAALAQVIGTLLRKGGSHSGYQCKDFMLAFSSLHDAVNFGLDLQQQLGAKPVLQGVNLGGLVQVGIHEGIFTSMGPHRTTGRADYYGKCVNRAARVAGATRPGDVCVGLLDSSPIKPALGSAVESDFLGFKRLAGLEEEMALFSCRRV